MRSPVRLRGLLTTLLVVGLMTSITSLQAEVAVEFESTIVMAITDGPDPISRIWRPTNRAPEDKVLNPLGHSRGDGRPDLAYKDSGNPLAVWAYNNGTDYDIAFSEWRNGSWSPTEFLTSSTANERDPRIHLAADGTVHIVWWVDAASPLVMYVSRDAISGSWGIERQVNPVGDPARRPSVVVHAGATHVAYERRASDDELGDPAELVIGRLDDTVRFAIDVALVTRRTGIVDPVLHVANGRLWVDWKHSQTQLGRLVENDRQWTDARYFSWLNHSWIGVENVRRTIRLDLFPSSHRPYRPDESEEPPDHPRR